MGHNVITHKNLARKMPRTVWFTNTGTALVEGQGVCYNVDIYTTNTGEAVTDPWAFRGNAVELPSKTNSHLFAGVAARDYPASSVYQPIEIYEPGSICNIALGDDATINSTYLTCSAGTGDNGRFSRTGFLGRGTAFCLETNASGNLLEVLDGTGALDATGKIITKSSHGLAAAGGAVGDKVALVGIEADGTNSGTPGIYTITAIDTNTITIDSAAADGGTMQCSFYVFSGNPKCLAYLLDGPESGLCEWNMPPNIGHASTATFTISQYGKTFLLGGFTSSTEHPLASLAQGTLGQKKAFECMGTVGGSYDITVKLATAGKQATVADKITTAGDGTPLAFVDVRFDAASEVCVLEFAEVWKELYHAGCTISSS